MSINQFYLSLHTNETSALTWFYCHGIELMDENLVYIISPTVLKPLQLAGMDNPS